MSDLQKHSERELAEMLQRGDASVMGKLYACYANFLTAVCSRYIIDYEDTRDILQESFIKIFTKGSSFKYREEGSLRAWLTQIVVNESLTFLKKYNPQNEMFGHFQTKRPFQQNETSSQSPANFSFSSLT